MQLCLARAPVLDAATRSNVYVPPPSRPGSPRELPGCLRPAIVLTEQIASPCYVPSVCCSGLNIRETPLQHAACALQHHGFGLPPPRYQHKLSNSLLAAAQESHPHRLLAPRLASHLVDSHANGSGRQRACLYWWCLTAARRLVPGRPRCAETTPCCRCMHSPLPRANRHRARYLGGRPGSLPGAIAIPRGSAAPTAALLLRCSSCCTLKCQAE